MSDIEELERALAYPWEKWTIFLHPAQRQWLEQEYSGPARVSGSAGTGKTIVALHRAVFLARRHPDARILLDEHVETTSGQVSISTMHLAKGLEFRALSVMACDDEIIPLQLRIETVADDTDLEEIYNTERRLLYVACTRARDHLLVTSVDPASEFLHDLQKR